jgi:hypothetical protein
MTRPAILVNTIFFEANRAPTHVADAPRRTKIMENPKMKKMELIMTVFCSLELPISSADTPDTKEMYPGTRGRTHGDKKEMIPATKAMDRETFCMSSNLCARVFQKGEGRSYENKSCWFPSIPHLQKNLASNQKESTEKESTAAVLHLSKP